ncbi:hypothetical protein RHSIM_Rhsim05G0029500 [Rhododendron simsii]|uniref:C3H1-type domain-containing protein n=1 Tax=Rhododendron simsii TaxID=118357 RepID=A0A834GXN8_RHOSS|nr:hypothetical protein RHSIM_Rhsim05G0029500 [Rhododendron simsii]
MMIGERNIYSHPTVHVPPWSLSDDPTADISFTYSLNPNADDYSPFDPLTELYHHLPSNDVVDSLDYDESGHGSDLSIDAYSGDQFRMFEFKVRKCTRVRSHDWTECPFAHPGEKARRRDPRKFHYSGTGCPDFRKGSCMKGDACEFAHGVFECWLHPARYRTQPCKDGIRCRRRVCFFAHTPDQLRVLGPVESGSSGLGSTGSVSPAASESPPFSPMTGGSLLSRSLGSNSVNEMLTAMRQLRLNKRGAFGLGSPGLSIARPGFCSLPTTPTRSKARSGMRPFDLEEEPVMERVESGKGLRAKMFEKLCRENPLDRVNPEEPNPGPDVGWVSELVK